MKLLWRKDIERQALYGLEDVKTKSTWPSGVDRSVLAKPFMVKPLSHSTLATTRPAHLLVEAWHLGGSPWAWTRRRMPAVWYRT